MNRKNTIYFTLLLMIGLFTISSCNDDDNTCTGQRWYEDADGDGFGNGNIDINAALTSSNFSCEQPDGFVSNSTDLDDTDPNVVCEATLWYIDTDGDGYGDPDLHVNDNGTASTRNPTVDRTDDDFLDSPIFKCEQPDGFVSNSDDQDDDNPDVGNCTGLVWYLDADGDGLGDVEQPRAELSCLQPASHVLNSDDVDDTDPNINCTGIIFYQDADGDGFGNPFEIEFNCDASSASAASGTVHAYVTNADDSDDTNPLLN